MMTHTITFLHTSPVHVPTFERLMQDLAPAIPVRHVVREDLLAEARSQGLSGAVLSAIAQSLADAQAEHAGLVVCTCSTIGGAAERLGHGQGQEVLRIDRAMAERAVAHGGRVAVVAALESTIEPTRQLLEQVAAEQGRTPSLQLVVSPGAWERFEQADRAGYLDAIEATLRQVAPQADVIVLAQASMADAATRCGDLAPLILSSPRLGAEAAVAAYQRLRATSYLQREPLQNIMPLKHLHTYGARIGCHYAEQGGGEGVLLLIPTQISAWDAANYPESSMVAMLICDTRAIGEALLDHISQAERVVFKLIGPLEKQLICERYATERTTAFISYTIAEGQPSPHPEVIVTTAPHADCLELFAAEGHDPQWLSQALAHGEALLFLKEQADGVAAACFAVKISGPIWEIGGLYTQPGQRRRGHAQHVVATALAALTERDLLPRYQVRESNIASARLAETLGMRPFVVVEHFRAET